jgi:FkbM family methyltransferase
MKLELIYRPLKKIFSISGISPSFSSDGEDYVISKYFMNFEGGVYIDIGSNHPVRHSNTFQLYLEGWSGLCVDPLPLVRSSYKIFRPRDTFVNAGITSKSTDHSLKYHYYRDFPDNSTFDPRRVEALRARFGREPSYIKEVKTISVDRLIDEYLIKITPDFDIQLLSLDTEGFESEIPLDDLRRRFGR